MVQIRRVRRDCARVCGLHFGCVAPTRNFFQATSAWYLQYFEGCLHTFFQLALPRAQARSDCTSGPSRLRAVLPRGHPRGICVTSLVLDAALWAEVSKHAAPACTDCISSASRLRAVRPRPLPRGIYYTSLRVRAELFRSVSRVRRRSVFGHFDCSRLRAVHPIFEEPRTPAACYLQHFAPFLCFHGVPRSRSTWYLHIVVRPVFSS